MCYVNPNTQLQTIKKNSNFNATIQNMFCVNPTHKRLKRTLILMGQYNVNPNTQLQMIKKNSNFNGTIQNVCCVNPTQKRLKNKQTKQKNQKR